MKTSILLRDAQSGHMALLALWSEIKPWLVAGHRLILSVKQETRSEAENALLHALLGHIAKTQTWAGKRHSIETWKRLLTASWCRAIGDPVEILPALDGCGVDIVFRRTSELSRKECAELIEFIYAWGAQHDVRFPAPEYATT